MEAAQLVGGPVQNTGVCLEAVRGNCTKNFPRIFLVTGGTDPEIQINFNAPRDTVQAALERSQAPFVLTARSEQHSVGATQVYYGSPASSGRSARLAVRLGAVLQSRQNQAQAMPHDFDDLGLAEIRRRKARSDRNIFYRLDGTVGWNYWEVDRFSLSNLRLAALQVCRR